jgi:hypothetical protein
MVGALDRKTDKPGPWFKAQPVVKAFFANRGHWIFAGLLSLVTTWLMLHGTFDKLAGNFLVSETDPSFCA